MSQLRVRTDSWQESPRPHSALKGDELAITAITMSARAHQRYPPEPEPEPEPAVSEVSAVTAPPPKRRPPPTTARVLTPNTAAAARRVSWGSNASNNSASSASDGETEAVAPLPLPMQSDSPTWSPELAHSTHVPAIKGARWVREQRVSAERSRRRNAEVATLRSSAEELQLQRDLSRVRNEIAEERLRLSQEDVSPPSRLAWSEAAMKAPAGSAEQATAAVEGDDSDTSVASSAVSDASSCAPIASGATSGFTMRMRFKLPSHRGGGSARLALRGGEDAFGAAERFGREHSLRGPEVEKVRTAIEMQLQRVEQRLRVGAAPAPALADPVPAPAAAAPAVAASAGGSAKPMQTWVAMTPEDLMEWRLLQQAKQKAALSASPSLPARELAETFSVRWADGGGRAAAPARTAGMVLPPTPHRATYSPRVLTSPGSPSSASSDSDSDSSDYSSDSSDLSDEEELVSALPKSSSADNLRLSADTAGAATAKERAAQQEQQALAAAAAAVAVEEAAGDNLGAPVVRGKSINIGVEGATPKEVKDVSLARTPTKQVKNMGRYKRRASKAHAEAELHAKLQKYTNMLVAATHRRGHARHVIDLPAHVVAQYRSKIADCQQRLAEMQPGYDTEKGVRFRPWFLGDVCLLKRGSLKGKTKAEQLPEGDVVGRVEYVGTAPSLGRGVWVGLVLENFGAPGEHDGTVGGRQYFSCEAGRGLLVRPDALLPVSPRSSASEEQ